MNKKTQAKPQRKNPVNTLGLFAGFGASFALEVYFIGVVFGGWLDEKLAHGKGYLTMVMVLFAIALSFITFFRIVLKAEKQELKTEDQDDDATYKGSSGK